MAASPSVGFRIASVKRLLCRAAPGGGARDDDRPAGHAPGDGRHWRADKFSTTCPASGKYLRGTITGYNRIECGIESYYVQEGTGRKYEQAIRSQKLSAEVAVTSDGQATLRALRIE